MYWVLEQDLRIPGQAAVMDVPDDFNILDWMSGRVIQPPPREMVLTLRQGSADYRGDIISGVVTLFSEELIESLTKFGVDNIQHFDVELKDPISGEIEYGYSLVNIVGLIACVDSDVGEMAPLDRPTSLERFSIDISKTRDVPIFRLQESPRLILISDQLHDFLVKQKTVGVRMRKTEEYTVW